MADTPIKREVRPVRTYGQSSGSISKTHVTAKKNKKSLKPLIAVIVIVIVLGLLVLYNYLTNRTVLSSPGVVGNSAGNLYNGGLFCEKDGRIYFSNPNDDNTLYSMSSSLNDFEKLYDDYARYINVDDNYVYYARMNNKKENPTQSIFIFYSTGVFRVTKSGKHLKMITSDPVGGLLAYDNKLYYQVYRNKALTLYISEIDGNNERKTVSDDTPMVSAYNGMVYYSGNLQDHDIHYVTPTGGYGVAFSASAYLPIATDEGMFYISTDGEKYRLYLSKLDGSNAQCIVDKPVSRYYNVTDDGRYVFYQCDEQDANAIYVLDRQSGVTEKIADGTYKWINLAGGYCFFFEFSSERAYAYNYETKVLNYFNPPSKK